MTHSGKAHLSLSQSLRVRIVGGGWDSEEEKSLGTYAWEASMPKKNRVLGITAAPKHSRQKSPKFSRDGLFLRRRLGKKNLKRKLLIHLTPLKKVRIGQRRAWWEIGSRVRGQEEKWPRKRLSHNNAPLPLSPSSSAFFPWGDPRKRGWEERV